MLEALSFTSEKQFGLQRSILAKRTDQVGELNGGFNGLSFVSTSRNLKLLNVKVARNTRSHSWA